MVHFESEGALILSFNRDIVEDMIGYLFFDLDYEEMLSTRTRALYVLK